MGSESGSKRSGSGVLTMVVFASAVAILLGLELRFNKHHLEEPFSIISVGDMTDLLTPYVLIVCYWGMYLDGLRFSGADGHALESPKTLLFILSSMIWCQGHALHNAANSIANAFEASGLHIRSPPHPSIVLPHIPRLGATVAHVAVCSELLSSDLLLVSLICFLGIHLANLAHDWLCDRKRIGMTSASLISCGLLASVRSSPLQCSPI